MSRNARTRSQLLSVYYNFTPFHARFLNVLLSTGIKIHRALSDYTGLEVHNSPIQRLVQFWLNLSYKCYLILLLYNFYVLVLTLYSFYTHLICQIRINFDFASIFCQSYVYSNVYSCYVLKYVKFV